MVRTGLRTISWLGIRINKPSDMDNLVLNHVLLSRKPLVNFWKVFAAFKLYRKNGKLVSPRWFSENETCSPTSYKIVGLNLFGSDADSRNRNIIYFSLPDYCSFFVKCCMESQRYAQSKDRRGISAKGFNIFRKH